ncbi:MAG: hypothetical protein HOP33_17010 [Verrucomicrobia bacterium]|nr:hypothetical protein [Verrucomicrobiota bacterium]
MKTQFWIFVLLLVIGAVLAGYWSGHYDGVRSTRIETQVFLRDFARSTDLEAYLQQRGQPEWANRIRVYGIGGSSSYIHSYRTSGYAVSAGIGCVGVGLIGLLFLSRRLGEKLAAQKPNA